MPNKKEKILVGAMNKESNCESILDFHCQLKAILKLIWKLHRTVLSYNSSDERFIQSPLIDCVNLETPTGLQRSEELLLDL